MLHNVFDPCGLLQLPVLVRSTGLLLTISVLTAVSSRDKDNHNVQLKSLEHSAVRIVMLRVCALKTLPNVPRLCTARPSC